MFPTVAAAADPGSLCFPAVASAGLRFPAARDAEARCSTATNIKRKNSADLSSRCAYRNPPRKG